MRPAAEANAVAAPSDTLVALARRLRRPLIFGLVGVANTLVDLAVFFVLVHLGLGPLLANPIAFAAGAANSYLLNSRITFRAREGYVLKRRILRFGGVTLVSLGVAQAALFVGVSLHWPLLAAKIAAIAATFGVGYVLNKLFVFRVAADTPNEP